MKNTKLLNLKNMKETIVNYSGDQEDFNKIWDTFYQMSVLGFISWDTWKKFSDQCSGWYVDDEICGIRDDKTGAVIWKYNSEAEYKA